LIRFIGAGYYTPEVLDRELKLAYSHLGLPVVLARDTRAEFGVGFLCWRLAVLNGGVLPEVQEAAERRSDAHTLIDVALRAKPRAIWLSFGANDEMRSWARVIREREAELNGPGDALKLFVMVGTEEELAPAVEQYGADVVVVQGEPGATHCQRAETDDALMRH
jgi:nitronate monooxygenase